MMKVASGDNPSDALTNFVPGELLLRHTTVAVDKIESKKPSGDGFSCMICTLVFCFTFWRFFAGNTGALRIHGKPRGT
jgi:hypothetical protein